MKRMIAILMAVLMLTGVLTACGGMMGMGEGQSNGNVSTTPDGRVNGGGYESGNSGMGGSARGGMNGSNGRGMGGSNSGGMGGTIGGGMGGAFGANGNSGTGMTGGR